MADSHPIENWRPVVGHEEFYEVSDFGRVRSWKHSRGRRRAPKDVMGSPDGGGYLFVNLYGSGRRWGSSKKIHRLVLEAFVGPRPPGMVGCHADGNKLNNRLQNLRWDTQKANVMDSVLSGVAQKGSVNGSAKLVEEQIPEILSLRRRGYSCPAIAKIFGVSATTILGVTKGVGWRHVPRNF